MARRAFSQAEFVKSLEEQFYIPVLIDGDVEEKVIKKFGVGGYPTVKFTNSRGEVQAQMRDRSARSLIAASKSAVKSMGGLRLTRPYQKLLQASSKLDRFMAKKRYRNALKAISDIEGVGHRGMHLERAHQEKEKIFEVAKERFDQAQTLLRSNPKKAKALLRKLSKEFSGLDVATEAKKLANTIQT